MVYEVHRPAVFWEGGVCSTLRMCGSGPQAEGIGDSRAPGVRVLLGGVNGHAPHMCSAVGDKVDRDTVP